MKKEIVKFPKEKAHVKTHQNVENVENVDKKIPFYRKAEKHKLFVIFVDRKYPQEKEKYPQRKKEIF